MECEALKDRLKSKPDLALIVQEIIENTNLIDELINIINTDKSTVKFSCTKLIRMVSEKKPELVYGYFDYFSKLLDYDNSFIKWDAITILSNLVQVDGDNKFNAVFDKYFGLIDSPQMITAANVVGNAWKIAVEKPELENEITKRILNVPKVVYFNKGNPSPECNNVICGHALDSFEKYFYMSKNKEKILGFAEKQVNNTRRQVSKKAVAFIKKHKK
jgi:hypothetical protein